MKGIILAGGSGTRLYPITCVLSKQILPIYNKPMIYYPLNTLMLAGIREILIISTPRDSVVFESLLGDGSKWGLTLTYAIQEKPRGLADAFIVGEFFIGQDSVCLILGDNLFWGEGLELVMAQASSFEKGAQVFGYKVPNPKDFGVLVFDGDGKVIGIEEKPQEPQSNYAVPGLYFYDQQVVAIAKEVKPSKRDEIEITSVNNAYLEQGTLQVVRFDESISWLDTGTHSALLEAGKHVEQLEEDGCFAGAIEATAYKKGYIDVEGLQKLMQSLPNGRYKTYLQSLEGGEKA